MRQLDSTRTERQIDEDANTVAIEVRAGERDPPLSSRHDDYRVERGCERHWRDTRLGKRELLFRMDVQS